MSAPPTSTQQTSDATLEEVTGGVAAAAATGVAIPEPATTTGGALILGGLAVGSLAADAVINRDRPMRFGELPAAPAQQEQSEIETPGRGEVEESEIPAEQPVQERSEIATPEDGVVQPEPLGIPRGAIERAGEDVTVVARMAIEDGYPRMRIASVDRDSDA
jgi:hypothetical protein